MILGDNIFYGQGFQKILLKSGKLQSGAVVFGYGVNDPERYGIVNFDDAFNVLQIDDKPKDPKSNYAIPGLYFYDNSVVEMASKIKPSDREELEITTVNKVYLKRGNLRVQVLGRGFAWLDTGTPEALLDASIFVETIEKRQGLKVACIEEVAYRMGYIDAAQVEKLARPMLQSGYGRYLLDLIDFEVKGAIKPNDSY